MKSQRIIFDYPLIIVFLWMSFTEFSAFFREACILFKTDRFLVPKTEPYYIPQ